MIKNIRAAVSKRSRWLQPYRKRKYHNLYLPKYRSNESLIDDEVYIQSAVDQIKTLQDHLKINPSTSLLDFGCGQGRLANGFIFMDQALDNYCGIDTDFIAIKWCQRWIQKFHPNFTFIHVNAHHPRYNPAAKSRPELPIQSDSFDIAFANSVFSHMLENDLRFYLKEIHKILRKGGLFYLTAFIEENVPDVEENPPGYLDSKSSGVLHRVRYSKSYFIDQVENCGFDVQDFHYRAISRTQQSQLIIRKLDH